MQNMTFNKIGSSVFVKSIIITFLAVLLFIPMTMVQGIIHERELRRDQVVNEVNSKWACSQTLAGPVLTIPYRYFAVDDKGVTRTYYDYANFLPEKLDTVGDLQPEKRHRGIYDVILYKSSLNIDAQFTKPDFSTLGIDAKDVFWERAYISIGLSDLRGLKENNMVTWNGEKIPLNSGIENCIIIDSGVSAKVPVSNDGKSYSFKMALNLNGSGMLNFIPLGKVSTFHLSSSWTSPSFAGSFLPDESSITNKGFAAKWKILNLNRNYAQQWTGCQSKTVLESSFGLNMFNPVDQYQKSTRSAKYAILFIVLTFVAFFLTEILSGSKIHPLQYLMIGMTICLFYTLLVSISEHAAFLTAYIVSSAATVLLVSIYSKAILKSIKISITIGALLTFLYSFLYVVLQLEDYALLMGSIGLFAVLGVVMFITRKIDWYNLSSKPQGQA